MIYRDTADLPADSAFAGGDTDVPYLRPSQVAAAFALVKAWMIKHGETDHTLYGELFMGVDHEGPFWNISLEGGPEEWGYRITEDLHGQWPAGVHVECGAMWKIHLYPDA